MSESKHNTAHAFSVVTHSLAMLKSMERNDHIQHEMRPDKERKANILAWTDISNKPVRKRARPPAVFRKKRLKTLLDSRATTQLSIQKITRKE